MRCAQDPRELHVGGLVGRRGRSGGVPRRRPDAPAPAPARRRLAHRPRGRGRHPTTLSPFAGVPGGPNGPRIRGHRSHVQAPLAMFIYRNRNAADATGGHRRCPSPSPPTLPPPARTRTTPPASRSSRAPRSSRRWRPACRRRWQREVLDFGLHFQPGRAHRGAPGRDRRARRTSTPSSSATACARSGVIGLVATHCRLVIPRVDDCIAIFLGSREEYGRQVASEPGTYYLTKGWIEAKDDPLHGRAGADRSAGARPRRTG